MVGEDLVPRPRKAAGPASRCTSTSSTKGRDVADERAAEQPARRIREDLRDGAYVMAFSCLASTSVAVLFVGLTRLAG